MSGSLRQRLGAVAQFAAKSLLPAAWFNRVLLPDGLGGGQAELSQPYAQSVWVMRAIKKIAAPIAAVPLRFTLGDNEDHEDLALEQFWEHPARHLTRHDFIEASVGWLKLKGEAFWLLGDDMLRPFPEVASYSPLIVARPDRMRERMEGDECQGWEFTDGRHRRYLLLPEQVVQPKYWNPYDDCRGLAEYAAARIAAEGDFAAGEYARNLMANSGDTGPIISAKSGMLDDIQQKQIITQLRMKQEYARRGEFRAAFLTSDVDVKNPTAQTVDANFAAMRLGNRHEIFLAFGVPPSMADKMESYSVGSASDWFLLITETCIPTSEKLAAAITTVARKQTGLAELTAYFDWDEHPVMQQVRRERFEAVEKLWSKGMPMREINDYLQLGMPEFEGWEVGYLPFSVAPVGSAALEEPAPEPTTAEDYAEETPGDAVQEAIRALRAGPVDTTRASRKELWESHMRRRLATVRAYQSRCSKVFNTFRAVALKNLDAVRPKAGDTIQRSLIDLLFDPKRFGHALVTELNPIARGALQTAGEELLREVGYDDPWTMPPQAAVDFISKRSGGLEKVGETARGQLNTAINEVLDQGGSMDDIAKAIRGKFNDLSKYEARRIAMTETSAAYGTARDRAMKDAGIEFKAWISSHGPNVRAAHRQAELDYGPDSPIPVDQPFRVGGEELMFPGDPDGSPENIINCQCVQIAVLNPKDE